jgi:hypothetical protein
MKAYIARNVFDDAGFYPVYQRIDPMMDKAFETLKAGGRASLSQR